jgi:hypothetical protein
MVSDGKLKSIAAQKCVKPLSVSRLIEFAEKVIKTDKDALLRAQNAITDLTAHSNDTGLPPKVSALSELCGTSRGIKLQSNDESSSSDKLVDINTLRRKN